MSGAGHDAMRDALIDFALWNGDTHEAAVWAAETYLIECAVLTLSPRVPSTSEEEGA